MAPTRHALRRASNALASASSASFSSAVKKLVKTPTTSSTNDAPKLLRHHLHDALYAPKTGYFTADADPRVPVGSMRDAIDFNALRGQDDYFRELNQRYAQLGAQWLTPAEIFNPHYANAVARFVLDHHRGDAQDDSTLPPLRVYELGGGTGTFARGFLDAMRREAPRVYERMKFTSVDISKKLTDAQKSSVLGAGHSKAVHEVKRGDATEHSTWGETDEEECFVIALEVLDNLPHDRVWRPKRGEGEWYQTEVMKGKDGEWRQENVPLRDKLIRRTLEAIELTGDLAVDANGGAYNPRGFMHSIRSAFTSIASSGDETWFVPTGAMKLIETLHAKRPNHRFIAADFDALPSVQIQGVNAPLVASQRTGGKTDDYDTYLLPAKHTGSVDVFFPTCFDTLRTIDFSASSKTGERKNARLGRTMTTKQFMSEYADLRATATQSGYNPIVQDFVNTKFYYAIDHSHDH